MGGGPGDGAGNEDPEARTCEVEISDPEGCSECSDTAVVCVGDSLSWVSVDPASVIGRVCGVIKSGGPDDGVGNADARPGEVGSSAV